MPPSPSISSQSRLPEEAFADRPDEDDSCVCLEPVISPASQHRVQFQFQYDLPLVPAAPGNSVS